MEKIPLVRRLKKPDRTTAAVPIYKAKPVLGNGNTESLNVVRPLAVDVKVSVAETGAVQSAEITDYGDPPNWNLATAALNAARQWTFAPARRDESPVSSEMILHFHFNP